jgi:drug/metabolite transporter (DMT)-like permease
MTAAGVSWGFYSLWGRGNRNPLAATTTNFVRAVPLSALVSAAAIVTTGAFVTSRGVLLAILSGALASGVGYVIWYAALRGLRATTAAIVQLAVPVIAAAGGVLFLSERVSLRLVVSAALILGGVGVAAVTQQRRPTPGG